MQLLAWTLVGVAYAALPLLVWWRIARPSLVRSAVGAALAIAGFLLVAIQHELLSAPRADAHLVFAVVAPLIVVLGTFWERSQEGPAPDQDAWVPRRNGAIGTLSMQFVVTLVASLFYALTMSEPSVPSASDVPTLPDGLTVESQSDGCGSGNCYRLLTIGSEDGLSYQEIVRRLDMPHETCRPHGWLTDRRDLCVGLDKNQTNRVVMYVTLNGLLD